MLGASIAVSASAGECVAEAKVGNCLGTGCFMGHGQAHCHGMSCLCDPGFCSRDGSVCEEAEPVVTTTTTHFIDGVIDKADTCGVKEYMHKGTFIKAVALCTARECGSWFWAQSKDKAACCSLQCAAEEVKAGLPDCWASLKGYFERQAAAMGSTGKRRKSVDVCILNFDNALPGIFEAESIPAEAMATLVVASACGCFLAGLAVVAFKRRRSVNFEQPPLLA